MMDRVDRGPSTRMIVRFVAALAVLSAASAPFGTQLYAQGIDRLQRQVERIIERAQARVGVGVMHLESAREMYVNGDEWFPMASTYKVPMSVQLLTLVDRGEIAIDSLVPLEAADFVPSGSLLTTRFVDMHDPGAHLSVKRYFELMVILSDNTATDVVLRLVGGTEAVTSRIRELGIERMNVSRTVQEIYAAFTGVELPPWRERNIETLGRLYGSATQEQTQEGSRTFFASRKDHATPKAMTRLLAKIWAEDAVSAGSKQLLLATMRRTETGEARLRGMLPAGTQVPHKTGTIDVTVTNDIGFIYLPDGAGHVAIVVYTKESTRSDIAARERVIAQIARAVYDYFVFNP